MRIKTDFVYPPIPDRSMDWCAWDAATYDPGDQDQETGRYHGGSPLGHGPTEQAAIDDLMQQLEEQDA